MVPGPDVKAVQGQYRSKTEVGFVNRGKASVAADKALKSTFGYEGLPEEVKRLQKYEAGLWREIEQLKENRERQRAVYREEENRDKALEELQGVMEEFDPKNDEEAMKKSSLPPAVLKVRGCEEGEERSD